MDSKISVIIPVYNVEPYIRQCLDSVVNQTYRNLEIIIIDDGSPDNCGKICDEYASVDKRIIVIHKSNEGLSAARNQGINMATGEWLAFVDSDDWIELDYYEKLIKIADSLKDKVDVICASGHIEEERESKTLYSYYGEGGLIKTRDASELLCMVYMPPRGERTNMLGPWDKLYLKDFIKNVSATFEGKAWEDHRFNMVVFANRPRVAISEAIGYHYRILTTSIMHNYNPEKPDINCEYVKWIQNYLKNKVPTGLKKQDLVEIMQMRIFMVFKNSLDCCFFHTMNPASYREIARQVKGMKKIPFYSEMLRRKGGEYFTMKQNIFRFAFRLPWIFPAKILYAINENARFLVEEAHKFTRRGG